MMIIAGLVGSFCGIFLMWMLNGHDKCNREIAVWKSLKEGEDCRVSNLLHEIKSLNARIENQSHTIRLMSGELKELKNDKTTV